MKKNYAILSTCLILFLSLKIQAQYDAGVFILNEGGFGANNASVSFLSDTDTATNAIFATENTGMDIGGVAQSMGFKDNNAYIVANGTNEINVVDRVSFAHISTITTGLSNPRYIAFDNGYAYVTNWGDAADTTDDYVAVIRLYDNAIVQTISVAEGPEEIVKKNNQMFVAHQGGWGYGNTISVIDLDDYSVSSINVADIPTSIAVDDTYLYVLSSGKAAWTGDETLGELQRIDLSNFSSVETFAFPTGDHPDYLEVNNGIAYYILGNNVYEFDFSDTALPTASFIDTSAQSLSVAYSLSVIDDAFYITDAVDYSSDGLLFTYDATGAYQSSYTLGVLPNGVYKYEAEVIEGVYEPAAGQAGTTAIAHDDALFTGWATGVQITRGYVDISRPTYEQNGSVYASYGTQDVALGAADNSVVSLGDAGEAILMFETPIANGDGFDFAVFENSFSDTFLELAFVEVSSDGINYFRFPAHSLTQTATQVGGFGAVDPTYINNLAGKYKANFGTPFDLDDIADDALLDKENITHVKIIDAVGSIDPNYASYDAFANAVNDPFPTPYYSSGFDLDAVGVINQKTLSVVNPIAERNFTIYPNPASNYFSVDGFNGDVNVEIYSYSGKLVKTLKTTSRQTVDISNLKTGLYLVKVNADNKKALFKLAKN